MCDDCSDCKLAGLHSKTLNSLLNRLPSSLLQLVEQLEIARVDDNIAVVVDVVAAAGVVFYFAAVGVVDVVAAAGGVVVVAVG